MKKKQQSNEDGKSIQSRQISGKLTNILPPVTVQEAEVSLAWELEGS